MSDASAGSLPIQTQTSVWRTSTVNELRCSAGVMRPVPCGFTTHMPFES